MADALAGMSRTMAEGVPDLTGAASATLGDPQKALEAAKMYMQQIVQARLGPNGGLVPGMQMSKPMVPLPPQEISPKGVIPQGPFASVGSRKRADTQALFSNISDIVQGAQKKKYEQKVQQLQHDFETMSNAMRGIEEGQATGNQEMVKHNMDIVNRIAQGKNGKELAKAFDVNINPMANEGKNKPEKPNPGQDAIKGAYVKDKQAYDEATKQGKAALSPEARAMMRQIPQTLQMDPSLRAQAQLVKDKLAPSADAQIQAYGHIADSIIAAQGRYSLGTLNKQAALLMRAGVLSAARLSSVTKLALEKERHMDKLNEIQKAHDLATKELNPLKQSQMLNSLGKTIDDLVGGVKLDNNGNVISSTGLKGHMRDTQKDVDDLFDSLGYIGRSTFSKQQLLENLDTILQSKHAMLRYGFTEGDMAKLKQIKALENDLGIMSNEIKSMNVTRIGIGKSLNEVGGKGVYGTGAGDTTDSEGVSGESDGNGQDDSGDDTELKQNINNSVDAVERSFSYDPPDQ